MDTSQTAELIDARKIIKEINDTETGSDLQNKCWELWSMVERFNKKYPEVKKEMIDGII